MHPRSPVLLVVLVLLLGACRGGDILDAPLEGRVPYVVDSDGAGDDLKAILYLLQRPEVSLRAVTMSGTGIAHCPAGARNAKTMLEIVGAAHIPVACGRGAPLQGFNTAPTDWRKNADTLGGMDLPEAGPLSALPSAELLAATIAASPEPVVLVALGPLTNVAEALEADPSFLDNVRMIYLMGGAVDVGGNVFFANPEAEFNIWADPHAAALVLASGAPITLVPLDATNDVPVTPYQWEVFEAYHETPAAAFLNDFLSYNPLFGGLYHWDELAAVISTEENVARFEDRLLVVVEEGGSEAGRTAERPDGNPVRVAVQADRSRFESLFYSALTGETRIDVPAWVPDGVVYWDGEICRYEGPDPLPDRMVVQLENPTAEMFMLVIGDFAPGATRQDLEDYQASGSEQPPPWWTTRMSFPAAAGGHDVWIVEPGVGEKSALCVVDLQRVWELAGPRLSE